MTKKTAKFSDSSFLNEDVGLSLLLYHSKLSIFGLWTKQDVWLSPLALGNSDQHFSPIYKNFIIMKIIVIIEAVHSCHSQWKSTNAKCRKEEDKSMLEVNHENKIMWIHSILLKSCSAALRFRWFSQKLIFRVMTDVIVSSTSTTSSNICHSRSNRNQAHLWKILERRNRQRSSPILTAPYESKSPGRKMLILSAE